MKCAVAILRILDLPFRLLPLKRKVTMMSRQFNEITLDFELLETQLKKDFKDIESVVLTKKIGRGIYKKIEYGFHMLRQMYHINTSNVVLVDGYCILACVLNKRRGQKIIQMWHSVGCIKKIGYQTLSKPKGIDPKVAEIMCLHKNYDYVLCSSKITAKYYRECFNVNNNQIQYLGMPRIDYIRKEKPDIKHEIYKEYPILKEKVNILYAPTFRKEKPTEYKKLIEKMDSEKYNLIIKTHLLEKMQFDESNMPKGVVFDKKFNIFDWLEVCNKVITDYSGISFEAAILSKEIYFYIYDYDEYEYNTGLNMNFNEEPISKYVFKDVKGLWKTVEDKYDRNAVERFREKYVNVGEYCCKDINNFICAIMD